MPVKSNLRFKEATVAVLAGVGSGLEEAAKEEEQNILENWDNDANALGQPWTPLAESTIRRKGFDSVLYERGDMYNSSYVRRTGPLSVALGLSDWKAPIHEYGTETIPPRPILGPAKVHLQSGVLMNALEREIRKYVVMLGVGMVF